MYVGCPAPIGRFAISNMGHALQFFLSQQLQSKIDFFVTGAEERSGVRHACPEGERDRRRAGLAEGAYVVGKLGPGPVVPPEPGKPDLRRPVRLVIPWRSARPRAFPEWAAPCRN